MNDSEFFWLSPEKVIEIKYKIVEVKARVNTLSYPEGKVGCVWPKITYGEWIDVPDKDDHEI